MKKAIIPILIFVLFTSCSYQALTDGYVMPEKTTVEEIDGVFRVMPQCYDMDEAMVFYPGGLVDPEAYIPLAAEMAHTLKMVVFIQKMPLDLAVLGSNRVEAILEKYSYIKNWYFSGHSLGGAMAASWIYDNPDKFKALILLGAYPIEKKPLNQSGIKVLSIRGSKDGLVSSEELTESRENLPSDSRFIEIKGGNHAQFGVYGKQKKDNDADISPEEQRREVIVEIQTFLDEINPRRVY
ncbi:alpha/beta hydrolase [Spirochaeta isovalerica]|uniref:Alpha/beta hydrolase fold-5 domain-containing protein n=1 Tax=Spirochaeta isovalerica TaxID=150 RepID=A0A841R5I9_9SPIO|nr:alpha/beta hydrolase [Spirochaeta isovalerica]MBB6478651.1 hypothetical protein [Spirochaeta isovalerica]